MDESKLAPNRPPGYWAPIKRRFYKKRLARLGLALVSLFFAIAALAPFLAGNRPLILWTEEGFSLPVFSGFGAIDFLWFSALLIPVVAWGFAWIRKRLSGHRSSKEIWVFALILCLAALISAALWPSRLDRTDYEAWRNGTLEARICIFPPVAYSPTEFDFSVRRQAPDRDHWLGTDPNGRDQLSRLLHGTRVSVLVGVTAVLIYVLIGVFVGALAGYFGGWIDLLLSRFIEIVICVPVLFAILAVFSFLPPSLFLVMVLIGLLRWPTVARLTRAEFLRLRKAEFVSAARALGASHWRIIFLQILPNSLAPVLVAATFGIAGAILLESGLSFLGFGVQPPTPSWGQMLAKAKGNITEFWWLAFYPGLAIFLAVTAFNLVGEGLRDALDPKMKK